MVGWGRMQYHPFGRACALPPSRRAEYAIQGVSLVEMIAHSPAQNKHGFWKLKPRAHLRNSPPSLLIIGNNYLKQLAFGARANSPVPICRSSNYHISECSRCARRIMLFLKVVMVVSKSKYVWGKNADAPGFAHGGMGAGVGAKVHSASGGACTVQPTARPARPRTARRDASPHLAAATERGPPGGAAGGQGWGEPSRRAARCGKAAPALPQRQWSPCHSQWHVRKPFGSTKAPRQWFSNDLPLVCASAVLPCAPCRAPTVRLCSAQGKALRKDARGTGMAEERIERSTHLSQAFGGG